MKKIVMACLFCLSVLAACGKSEEKVSIAILTPVTHPSLVKMEQGFVDTIQNQFPGKYTFVTYNAQGNKTLMRSEIEEIAKGKFEMVLTVGTLTTQMATEVFSKKEITMPIVFTAVNATEKFTGEHVTGVKEMLRFDEEIAALIAYKPSLSSVLLVYNPTEPGLQKNVEEIDQILRKRDITLNTIEVFQTNELKAKVSPSMDTVDAVIILKDNTVVAGLEVLSKLCNGKSIPLMASDLDSPDRGAAFGYGVYEYDFGVEAAKKALQILEEGVSAGSIQVTPVSNFTLRVNSEAAKAQGIEVQP